MKVNLKVKNEVKIVKAGSANLVLKSALLYYNGGEK